MAARGAAPKHMLSYWNTERGRKQQAAHLASFSLGVEKVVARQVLVLEIEGFSWTRPA